MTLKDTGLYIELENLGDFACNTAKMTDGNGVAAGAKTAEEIFSGLRNIKNITAEATAFAAGSRHIPQEIEWLLDNWYIAEREGKDAAFHLKQAGRLPAAGNKNIPAIAEAADALVRSGRGKITAERLQVYLDGYQNYAVFSEKELSLFIPMVKAQLVFFLEDACRDIQRLLEGEEPRADLAFLMENIFTSLRFLSNFNASEVLERVNRVEAVFAADPAGVYLRMDEKTRRYYRREISKLAEKNGMREYEAASRAVELAKNGENNHVGYYIFTKPLGKEKRKTNGSLYISILLIGSLFFTVLLAVFFRSPVVSLLLFFPVSEIMKNLVDFIVVKVFKPRLISKLDMENGVPEEGKTICVISALLGSKESVSHCAGLLEEYRLANRDAGENLVFGILGDLPEAEERKLIN